MCMNVRPPPSPPPSPSPANHPPGDRVPQQHLCHRAHGARLLRNVAVPPGPRVGAGARLPQRAGRRHAAHRALDAAAPRPRHRVDVRRGQRAGRRDGRGPAHAGPGQCQRGRRHVPRRRQGEVGEQQSRRVRGHGVVCGFRARGAAHWHGGRRCHDAGPEYDYVVSLATASCPRVLADLISSKLYSGTNGVQQSVFTWLASETTEVFAGDIAPLISKLSSLPAVKFPASTLFLGHFGMGSEAFSANVNVTFSMPRLSIDIGT